MLTNLLKTFSVAIVAILLIFSVQESKADLIQDLEMTQDMTTWEPVTSPQFEMQGMSYAGNYTGYVRLPFEFEYDDHVYPANSQMNVMGCPAIQFMPYPVGSRYPYYLAGRMASYYSPWGGTANQAVKATLYAFYGYVYYFNGTGTNGWFRYQTIGNPGSRIAVFEWTQHGIHYYYDGMCNVQIRLHEGSNKIEFIYGDMNLIAGYPGTPDTWYWDYTYVYNGTPYYYYPIAIGLSGYQGDTKGSNNYVNVYTPGSFGFTEWTGLRSETDGIGPREDYGSICGPSWRAAAAVFNDNPGIRLTWGASDPKLIDSYPANNAIMGIGRMYPSSTDPNPPYTENERPGVYVIRLEGMPSINIEMDIYPKGQPENIVWHSALNNITPESPDKNTPVKVSFFSSIGVLSGDDDGFGGHIDVRDLAGAGLVPGDYYVKVKMTMNDKPEFLKEIQQRIIFPVNNDLEVYSIDSPKLKDKKIYPITGANVLVTVRNSGLNPRGKWQLYAEIYDANTDEMVWEGTPFDYPDSLDALETGETYQHDFDYFIPDAVGDFYMKVWVEIDPEDAIDQYPQNNTVPWDAEHNPDDRYIINFAYEIDIRAVVMVAPLDEGEITVQRPFKPECSFTNLGVMDGDGNTIFMLIKNSDGDTVYYDVLYEDDDISTVIYARDTTVIQMREDYVPAAEGVYDAWFWIVSENDDKNPDLKTMHTTFTVLGALEGNYTIGLLNEPGEGEDPNPRNFRDLQTAADALYRLGVTAPVIFEFTDKLYEVGSTASTDSPALDLSAKITGMSAENTVTFRPSQDRAIEQAGDNSGVTLNLNSGNGWGIRFGQNPFPQNPFAVAFYFKPPTERVSDEMLPEYVNSAGYFIFDGLRNKSLRFRIITSDEGANKFHNIAMYFGEGSNNITIQNCVFENPMSDGDVAHSRLPHTRRMNSTREYQDEKDFDELGGNPTSYSAAIVLRAKVPVYEDGQNRLFFDTLSCDNNVIKGNRISGFGYGIASMGSGPLLQEMSGKYGQFYNRNNEYSENEIFNVSQAGIFLGYEIDSKIMNNRIYNVLGNSPDIDDNLGAAAGIILGNAGSPDDPSWNKYNNMRIEVTGNEISDVTFAGDDVVGSAIGIYVVQGQNQMINPSTGFTYFPNEAEEFLIKNNIISGLNSSTRTSA